MYTGQLRPHLPPSWRRVGWTAAKNLHNVCPSRSVLGWSESTCEGETCLPTTILPVHAGVRAPNISIRSYKTSIWEQIRRHISFSFCAVAPKVTGPTSSSLEVSEHKMVTLTCTAVAHPTPVWKWYFNGTLKKSYTTPNLTSTLVIASVLATDSGMYSCAAFNNATGSGGVLRSATLTVHSESDKTRVKNATIKSLASSGVPLQQAWAKIQVVA